MTPYAPPPHDGVTFDFTTASYAPPAHDAVTIDFGATGSGGTGGGPTTQGGIVAMLIGL